MTEASSSPFTVRIYTDGSCLGNPGRGGWAAILTCTAPPLRKECAGGYRLTTNNRMEILAVIHALEKLKTSCTVELYTDSRYVCDSITKGWVFGWQKRHWLKANKQPVPNTDLWQRLLPLLKRHNVCLHWLRGHAGHPENERCDQLAHEQASRRDLPPDSGYPPAMSPTV